MGKALKTLLFSYAGQLTHAMKQKLNGIKEALEPKANLWAAKVFINILKPLSRFSRKVFEFHKIKQILGVLVIISVISLSILPPTIASAQANVEAEQVQIKPEVAIVKEPNISVRLPLDEFTITQGYRFMHPGIDLATIKGAPVYAVMEGTVTTVKHDSFSYGNHVIIDHSNGNKTLYAHLAKIEVEEGEKVTNESIVGLAGSTGWSTGPHLHFQVWLNEKLVNPKTFFEAYLGQRLISNR